MAKYLNRATLLGNVGAKPEGRSAAGKRVVNASLATTSSWKDKDGKWQEKTQWHRLTFWSPLAEVMEKYVEKGSKIMVEGPIEYGKYTDQDNIERYTVTINVRDLYLLSGKSAGTEAHAPAYPDNADPNTYNEVPAALREQEDRNAPY